MESFDDDVGVGAEVRAAETAASPPYTILHTKRTPVPFKFTWAKQAVIPCKVGVRKDVYALGGLIRYVSLNLPSFGISHLFILEPSLPKDTFIYPYLLLARMQISC